MAAPVIPGAEALSHSAGGDVGVLVIHGFTGNPGSMRGLAEAFVGAGFDVEMPRLAGHGTTIEEMLPTRWIDWVEDVEGAYAALSARVSRVVVAGLSMGGSLTLWVGAHHPEVAGLVCVNPATMPLDRTIVDAVEGMIASGMESMDGIGSDIADPDTVETAYPGTPLQPLKSFHEDGLVPLSQQYGAMKMPLLLFTSAQDHVVNPENSAYLANKYGGSVEHVTLERSFHVATQDFDKQLIFERSVEFVRRVTA